MYAAEDVNSTANTLFMYVASRDLQNGTGRNTTINTVSGDTMRLLAHRYGFHTFETGAFGVNSTGNFVQVPYVPAFLAPKKITAATNASPIVITTSAAHGYTSGDTVFIKYVEGNLAANGTFSITVLSPTTFSLNASAGSGAFSGTLGLVANQTPPYIEILENTWISFGLTTGAGWNTNYSSYGLGTAAFGGIFDGVVLQNTANCSFLFPRAVNTGGTAFNWGSGAWHCRWFFQSFPRVGHRAYFYRKIERILFPADETDSVFAVGAEICYLDHRSLFCFVVFACSPGVCQK